MELITLRLAPHGQILLPLERGVSARHGRCKGQSDVQMHRKYSDLCQWQLFTSMCWRHPLPWWLPLQRLWLVRDKAQRSQLASQRCIKDEGGCTDNNQCPGFDSVCNIPAHDNCFFCDLPSENCLEGKESHSPKFVFKSNPEWRRGGVQPCPEC